MGILTSVSVDEIRARGSIKDSDVLKLQRALRDGLPTTVDDAEQLLALDAACPVKDPSWLNLLVDAVSDYVVFQAKPEGYMVRAKAEWLIGRLDTYRQSLGQTAFELLISVLQRSRWSPPSLAVFGLNMIRAAVATGVGPLRVVTPTPAGTISEQEINLVARLLAAFTGGSDMPVTRAEADCLIDINKAIAPDRSSPAWTELFVKAVGNAALSGMGMVVADRRQALGAEAWLVGPAPATGTVAHIHDTHAIATPNFKQASGFAGRMIAGGAGSVWATCRLQSAEERALMRLERQRREIITNERLDEADAPWLLSRIATEGRFDDNEIALLAFLQREAAHLPQPLVALAARATIAA